MSSILAIIDPGWRGRCKAQGSKTLRERFNEKTVRDESGCLLWLGAHDKDESELAMHRCDRPACVEESHLLLGDNSANQIDSIRKHRKGSQRLTVEDIVVLRQRYEAGESQASLSREFGIDDSHAHNIVRRKKWKHVA